LHRLVKDFEPGRAHDCPLVALAHDG
jgi:hypothetical protein